MSKLIRFEFRKLFHQKSFYICLAILAFLTVLQVRSSWNARVDAGLDGAYFVQESLINSGTTFIFVILLSIFSAMFISEDYSVGTIRNIITRGYSRTAIYFSKLAALCCGTIIMLSVCWVSAYLTAKVVYDGTHTAMNVMFLMCMLAQILVIAAYTCIFNAAASLVRKTGAAIAVCVVLPITVSLILTMLETTLNRGNTGEQVELARYWLEYLLSGISIVSPTKEIIYDALKVSPVYIAVSTAAGWLFTFKREY